MNIQNISYKVKIMNDKKAEQELFNFGNIDPKVAISDQQKEDLWKAEYILLLVKHLCYPFRSAIDNAEETFFEFGDENTPTEAFENEVDAMVSSC